jgi:hypothetical protein
VPGIDICRVSAGSIHVAVVPDPATLKIRHMDLALDKVRQNVLQGQLDAVELGHDGYFLHDNCDRSLFTTRKTKEVAEH